MDEISYAMGQREAYVSLLRIAIAGLGYNDDEGRAFAWAIERESAIVVLRQLCFEFGDNNWSPDLHLADIIEKHLADHLFADFAEPDKAHQPPAE